jgi:hypothetical protein
LATTDGVFVYVLKRLCPGRSGDTMVAGVFTSEAMGRRVFDTLPLDLRRRAMLVRVPLPREDEDGDESAAGTQKGGEASAAGGMLGVDPKG